MRSIALVVAGLVAGFAAGQFSVKKIQNEIPTAEVQTKTTPSANITSPFATVAEPAVTQITPDENNSTTTTPETTELQATETQYTFPTAPAADINHYRDLNAYLQHIEILDEQQLETLLDQFRNTSHQISFSHALGAAIYQRWAELDTDSALEHAVTSLENRNGYGNDISRYAITLLASQYPDTVSSKAAELEPHSHLQYVVNEGLAAKDPEKFLRNLLESDNSNGNLNPPDMTMMALMSWAEKDPAAAWDFVNTEYTGQLEFYHHENILSTWFQRDPDAAIPEIEAVLNNSSRPEEHMMLIDLYTRHLAQDNPEAAIQWASSLPNSMLREQALMGVIYNQETGDASSMISFIDQLSPEDKNTIMPMAAPAIAQNLAATDPLAALEWTEQLPQNQRDQAQTAVISQWSYTDPEAAVEWVLTQPDTPENQQQIHVTALAAIHTNPEAAKQIYDRLPATTQTDMVGSMISALSRQGPDAAAQWLSEQSNPDVQQMGAIYIDLSDPQSDTYATLEKISALQTPGREDLLLSFLSQRSFTDTDAATQWVSETTSLTQEQREMAEQMIDASGSSGRFGSPYGGSADFYFQNIEERIRRSQIRAIENQLQSR